ncbi:hypothetical protein VTL71DRAFT_9004 [Oculimacula yallundae]|uniref:Peptidase M24 domain-containing protein n=1 Tax=Oculimacula yallundae TaxID=86028 RepID=A0ABR4BTI1_9HELO
MHFPTLFSLLLHSALILANANPKDVKSDVKSMVKGSEPPRDAQYHTLPSLRDSARIQDAWTKERIEGIPRILRKWGVDAWLMTQREYAEDTAFWSLKSATQFSARRRTMNLYIANPTPGTPSAYTWIDNTPEVYTSLTHILTTQNPQKIAVNTHPNIAFSSGLHVGELASLKENIDSKWIDRFVDVPMVAVEFIGTQPEAKLDWYRKMQETAWAMIGEAFSEKVIEPGVSSTEDVEWWLRSKIQEQNYTTWFQPDVNIIGVEPIFGPPTALQESLGGRKREVIQYGDNKTLLHVDFGITALGMNTDTQHLAYVLPPHHPQNHSSVPSSYLSGLHKANRLQDIVISHMIPGHTGNFILNASLAQMRSEGFEGKIYCHPIGDWGHSAGTVIGMTNLQEGVPVLGELPLLGEGYYSIELSVEHWVEEVGAKMMFYQEEDVYWAGEERGWEWVWGRQERFHLIRAKEKTKGWEEVEKVEHEMSGNEQSEL